MKKIIAIGLAAMLLTLTSMPVLAAKPDGKGFDEYGYNYQARIFNGLFGNSDENRPGDGNPDTYFDESTNSYGYKDADGNFHEVLVNVAGTHLVMKWSEAWHMAVFGPDNIRKNGDEEPWNDGAWCTNHVVGTGVMYDTEGEVIYEGHLTILSKIRWVGDTSGYTNPIWTNFAVIHKIFSGHGLGVLEVPSGFGAPLP